MQEMEAFYCYSAKLIQRLLRQAATPRGLVSLGWRSLQAVVDEAKLEFMCHVLLLPMSSVYKVVMIKRMYNIVQGNNITKGLTANIVTINNLQKV